MTGSSIQVRSIGTIRTPYTESAPYQPLEEDEGEFRIVLEPEYVNGLEGLSRFRYMYVIYHVHRAQEIRSMIVSPPWAEGVEVGVFASRSPVRPNPLGISIVKIIKIEGREIHTSGLDVFDGTPLLDIKPYIKDLDVKSDANYGWIDDMDDKKHLTLHIKGIPHDHH